VRGMYCVYTFLVLGAESAEELLSAAVVWTATLSGARSERAR